MSFDDFELTVDSTPLVPEEEWLEATLVAVSKIKGKYGPQLLFNFKLLKSVYNGTIVQSKQSAKVSNNANSKTNRFYSALCGRALSKDQKVKVQDYVDCTYRVFIENRRGSARVFQNVTRIQLLKIDTSADAAEATKPREAVAQDTLDKTESIKRNIEFDDETPW